MKNLTKKLSTVLVILMMLVTTTVTNTVYADSDADTATVTISGLQNKDKVTLYKVVKSVYDGSNWKEFELIDGLIDVNQMVQLTYSDGTKNYKINVLASNLDKDGDGKIDSSVVLDSVTATADGATTEDTITNQSWTVGNYVKDDLTVDNSKTASGKILYNMKEPTQKQINLVVSADPALLTDAIKISPDAEANVIQNTGDYAATAEVPAGQYIGIITPATGNDVSYNPVVVSAGFKGVDVYKQAATGTSGTHYKKTNGEFTEQPPTAATKHLYVGDVWDDTNNQAKDPTWVVDDTQPQTSIVIAKDLDLGTLPNNATNYLYGTNLVAKKQQPKVDKSATATNSETGKEIALVASQLKNDDCELDANGNLKYIKSEYKDTYTQIYADAKAGNVKYKLDENSLLVKDVDNGNLTGQQIWNQVTTNNAEAAAKVSSGNEKQLWNGGQGDVVNYTVTATIPQYPLNAKNKTLTFTDKMSDGLDYVEGSLELSFNPAATVVRTYSAPNYVFYIANGTHNTSNTDASLEKYALISGAMTKVDSTNVSSLTNGQQLYVVLAKAKEGTTNDDFQINFNYDNLPGAEGSKSAPIITYKSVIKDTAIKGIAGNDNVARMYYANSTGQGSSHKDDDFDRPNGDGITERHDSEKIYTYEIKFRKTNDVEEYIEKPADSTDAKTYYKLKDADAATDEATWNELKASAKPWYSAEGTLQGYLVSTTLVNTADKEKEVDTAKQYVVNPKFEKLANAVFGLYDSTGKLVTTIKTNDDGFGHSTLVSAGTYTLKELTPPPGYAKLTKPIEVTANWTSAYTKSEDTVTRYVYTTDLSKALDVNNNGAKPAAADASDNTVSNAAANAYAEDQVGWLVGTGNVPLRDLSVYDITAAQTKWTYNEATHTMTHTDGTVINNVFRAYLEKETTTTTVNEDVQTNYNAGTVVPLPRINNTKTPELPSTGGIGTYLFTIAGVAIIATAAFMLIFRKKEEHNH